LRKRKILEIAMVPKMLYIAFIIIISMYIVEARIPGVYSGGQWQDAHATFYGGSDASGTMGM
jgi:hypothetical protein